ncbi:MAG: hypothetical protein ABJP14_14805 [Roseibium sp.]
MARLCARPEPVSRNDRASVSIVTALRQWGVVAGLPDKNACEVQTTPDPAAKLRCADHRKFEPVRYTRSNPSESDPCHLTRTVRPRPRAAGTHTSVRQVCRA